MSKENESIFNQNGNSPQLGVAFHNVGLNGVLDVINPDMTEAVHKKYQMRGGHIPNAQSIGLVTTHEASGAEAHVNYLSRLYRNNLGVYTLNHLVMESPA